MWCRRRLGWYCNNCDQNIQVMRPVGETYLNIGSSMFIPGSISGSHGMLCEGCGDLFEKYFVDQVKFADGVSICNACGGPEGKIYLALYWIAPFPKTRLMSNGMRRIQICSKERGHILDELQSLLTNPLIL